jgi:hypothetical protein
VKKFPGAKYKLEQRAGAEYKKSSPANLAGVSRIIIPVEEFNCHVNMRTVPRLEHANKCLLFTKQLHESHHSI